MKILIVDDSVEYAEGVSGILETEGYSTIIALNADDAIELTEKENPDILIVDWKMPKMDGIELIRYLKSNPVHKSKYIIMLSGKSTIQDKVTGIDAGADDYLTKPFATEELLARIRSAVRIIELQNELMENERKNTVLEMALSLTDKIGNPIAAAQMFQQIIKENINEPSKIKKQIDDLGKALEEAQDLLRQYQKIKNPKSISAPLGKKMIDPNSESN